MKIIKVDDETHMWIGIVKVKNGYKSNGAVVKALVQAQGDKIINEISRGMVGNDNTKKSSRVRKDL